MLASYLCSHVQSINMRRLAIQVAGKGHKRASTLSGYATEQKAASMRRARPLRETYVALSDFFRSSLQQAPAVTKVGSGQSTARWLAQASSGTAQIKTQPLHYRSFATTSRWTGQPPESPKRAVDQGQTHSSEDQRLGKGTSHGQKSQTAASGPSEPIPDVVDHVSSFPRSLRQLAMSLPTASLRRPTKDE